MSDSTNSQSEKYINLLPELLNDYLRKKGWNCARLANESGFSKATISRITKYKKNKKEWHQPEEEVIIAIALALRLSLNEYEELRSAAFPERMIWLDSLREGRSLIETNEILYDLGLPIINNK